MIKYIFIDNIEIGIGDNLYLRIDNIKYSPGTRGKFHGLPENWEEPEGPEIEFENHNCYLIHKKEKKELAFPAPEYFADNYIEDIIIACEEEISQ